jgi:hypothetical protein
VLLSSLAGSSTASGGEFMAAIAWESIPEHKFIAAFTFSKRGRVR